MVHKIGCNNKKLIPNDGVVEHWFAYSVAFDGYTAVISATFGDENGLRIGSVYVFVRLGTTWTQHQKLVADDGATGDGFGISFSMAIPSCHDCIRYKKKIHSVKFITTSAASSGC